MWDREGHQHKVKRLSNITKEIESTKKPRRGEALRKSEDENKGKPSNGNGNMNREECGAPKRQRKSVVRTTAENWRRENR